MFTLPGFYDLSIAAFLIMVISLAAVVVWICEAEPGEDDWD